MEGAAPLEYNDLVTTVDRISGVCHAYTCKRNPHRSEKAMDKVQQATRKAVTDVMSRIFDVPAADDVALITLTIFGSSSENAHDALCGDLAANFAFGRTIAPDAAAKFAILGLKFGISAAFDFALIINVLSGDDYGVRAVSPYADPIVALTAKLLPLDSFSEALLSIRQEAWTALDEEVAILPFTDEDDALMSQVLDNN